MELKHKNLFLQAYRKHYLKKICHGVKQNAKNVPLVKQNVMKLEVIILGRQRIDQKRKKGEGEGEGEVNEREQDKRDKRKLSLQFEEENKKHQHLPLLVVQLQGTKFPTRFCSKALQQ